MKYPGISVIMAGVVFIYLLAGCTLQQNSSRPMQQSGQTASVTVENESDSDESKVATNVVEITDPDELERIWSKYIFDGITSVLNTEFNAPSEIETRFYLIKYALQRMVKDGDIKPRSVESRDLCEIDIPTAEQIQSKIKQYFNIDLQLDLEKELKEGFGISKGEKTMRIYSEQIPYDAGNPWDVALRRITYDKTQGEYTVILDHIANHKTGRIERITYITLKERDDKSLYYVSVKSEYPQTKFVEISGDYTMLKAEDFGAEIKPYISPASVYGSDIGGKLLLQADRLLDEKSPDSGIIITFSIYDPRANKVEKRFEIPQAKNSRFHSVRILPDKLIFKMTDSFFVTGPDLERKSSNKVPLPDVIKEAMADENYMASYDVSADLKRIAFTDRNGLYIHDLNSGETKKLASHIPVKSNLFDKAYIIVPYFSADDKVIISKLSGYEGYYGVMVLNLDHPNKPHIEKNINILGSMDYTCVMYPIPDIRYIDITPAADGKMPEVQRTFGIRMVNLESFSDPRITEKSDISKVIFEDEKNQQPIDSVDNIPIYNGKYLAYVAARYEDGSSPDEMVYHIVRIDLETMKAETVLSIKAGIPYLRAVTQDGRIMFSYHFGREWGLAITGK
ncbi:MAG: hypothetical protein PWQ68_1548 [Thermoanaerobacteraceae bacterium]|nr:hypothetical protein [Thermoanaerobacteraceae bacterium]